MEKLNELFSRACDLSERGEKCTVDLNELTAIRDEFWALKHRAEAAEAKLAELEKQEPVVWCSEYDMNLMRNKRMIGGMMTVRHHGDYPLFTRPTPAINLAELAPDGWQLVPVEPTEEMISAALKFPAQTRKQYAAMLAAAPKPSTN